MSLPDEIITTDDEDKPSSDLVPTVVTRAGLPAGSERELVVQGAFPTGAHPVGVYLLGLSSGSRRTMKQSLDRIAGLVMGRPAFDALHFNWPALRYQHTTWIRAALEDEFAPSTANKMIAALRGVMKESWRLGYITAEDFHRAIDLKTVSGFRLPPGRRLTTGEMEAFFKSCAKDRTKGAVLDAALFAALVAGGLRRGEAAALHLDSFDADGKVLRVLGKGNKQREVPLQRNAVLALNLWVNVVRGFEPGPLFCPVRKNGRLEVRPMSEQAIYMRLQRRGNKASVNAFTPHDLRRTYASGMLDKGADVFAVQKLLGHADVKTTGRYDVRDETAKRKAADLFHLPFVEFKPDPRGTK